MHCYALPYMYGDIYAFDEVTACILQSHKHKGLNTTLHSLNHLLVDLDNYSENVAM